MMTQPTTEPTSPPDGGPPKLTDYERARAEVSRDTHHKGSATYQALDRALIRLDYCEQRLALLAGMEALLEDLSSASTSEHDAAVVAAAMVREEAARMVDDLAEGCRIDERHSSEQGRRSDARASQYAATELVRLAGRFRALGPTLPLPDPGELARLRAIEKAAQEYLDWFKSGAADAGKLTHVRDRLRKALEGGPAP